MGNIGDQVVIRTKHNNGTARYSDAAATREAAGQTYLAGQLVKLAASAAVTANASTDTVAFGISQTAATGVTGASAIVEIIEYGDVVEMSASSVPTIANFDTQYGIVVASNITKLDLTNTTQKIATLVGFVYSDDKKTITKRVLVQFLAASLQVNAGL